MKNEANRLALQHLINAYIQETGRGVLLGVHEQTTSQRMLSADQTLLSIQLAPLDIALAVPLSYVSVLGRHRLAAMPQVWSDQKWIALSPVAIAGILLEDIVQHTQSTVDAASLLEKWVQSRDALIVFLEHRIGNIDAIFAPELSFVESEQGLILGHAMHPSPKSRQGFVHADFVNFSPETQGRCQLHFWLVHPDFVTEGSADHELPSDQLKRQLQTFLTPMLRAQIEQYPTWKLLPLHPWQARFLMGQPLWKALHENQQIISLGELGWQLFPSTSIRTLCGPAPWMFKPSLSVSITNSVRVNQHHECLRGEISCRLWRSPLGRFIQQQHRTLSAVNDPAWIALTWQGSVVSETICILRDNPFATQAQVTCMATLTQDHPLKAENRLTHILQALALQTQLPIEQVASTWFTRFLEVAVQPMLSIYMQYGMAFEAHQQNTLLELDALWPSRFWLRDNQGFYYIEEYAEKIIALFPELTGKAESVGPREFVDERFIYYFFGNTIFGLINALGATGFIHERTLIKQLQHCLIEQQKIYPHSSLIQQLLEDDTLPYKGNLLTRLHELDELTAPLEFQSVYIRIQNPLLHQKLEKIRA
ncbi:IucA/IucC family protein [Aquirhabdus sp.]|uniref:IucA/IucC family protein n=1 Tax=Aquirhabdus sp. TaxID=2824160 RepID=UPI00396D0410